MTTLSLRDKFNKLVKAALSQKQEQTEQTDEKIEMIDKSAKSQDYFQSNNPTERKYTTKRIKSRIILSNIAYVGVSKEDFYNENFFFDVHLLVTKNLNPFPLDIKLDDKKKHEMIYILWKEFMPLRFYQHIWKEKNFLYFNGKNGLQRKVSERITDYSKKEIKIKNI